MPTRRSRQTRPARPHQTLQDVAEAQQQRQQLQQQQRRLRYQQPCQQKGAGALQNQPAPVLLLVLQRGLGQVAVEGGQGWVQRGAGLQASKLRARRMGRGQVQRGAGLWARKLRGRKMGSGSSSSSCGALERRKRQGEGSSSACRVVPAEGGQAGSLPTAQPMQQDGRVQRPAAGPALRPLALQSPQGSLAPPARCPRRQRRFREQKHRQRQRLHAQLRGGGHRPQQWQQLQ